jgi:hypothetical protein
MMVVSGYRHILEIVSTCAHILMMIQSAYGCSNDDSQNCLAYAGCEILVDTPQSALQVGSAGNNNIDNVASKPLEQNPDAVSNSQTTSEAGIATPNFVELNEVCSGKYMMANGVESCELLCKPFECKSVRIQLMIR